LIAVKREVARFVGVFRGANVWGQEPAI